MFGEDREIVGCPAAFRDDCKNYEVQCYNCKANKEVKGDNFYYSSFGNNLEAHPYIKELKQNYKEKKQQELIDKNNEKAKQSRIYNRKGKQLEQKVIKSIEGAKLTHLSGAQNNDSDGYIIIGDTKLRLGHKGRFVARNELGPTKAEWEKGKKEGCDIWLTTSDGYDTIVTMPKSVLDELIMLAQENNGT